MLDQQGAHLPSMTHLFDHHASDGATVPIGGRGLKQMALLLAAGKLCIALIDDHVEQRVAHLLGGNLAQVLPFTTAPEVTELDLFGLDCAVESIKLKLGDLIMIDADLFAPLIEQANPVTECSDFCYFAGHKFLIRQKRQLISSVMRHGSKPCPFKI